MKMENGPLTGVKVLDLSLLLPGPLCSQHLADMGAEVIKVENPRLGDLTRYMGTKVTKGEHAETGFFLQLNRNKKSICVNIKRDAGREVILRLLKDCDILLEGFRPDTLNELGIGYEQLKEKFPRLIYCAISGYGATGHYKEHAGHDANYIARAGLLALNGVKGGPPIVPGFQVADIGGGTLTALAPKKRGRKPTKDPMDKENERLRRRVAQLEHKLETAELIIDVQKKVSQLLGIPLATIEQSDES